MRKGSNETDGREEREGEIPHTQNWSKIPRISIFEIQFSHKDTDAVYNNCHDGDHFPVRHHISDNNWFIVAFEPGEER